MKCGHCKGNHATVQQVRECANGYSSQTHNNGRDLGPERNSTRRAPSQSYSIPDVPAGRYAVEMDGVLKFYRVDRPTSGRWAGYTFVKVYASDETHPVRGSYANSVLRQIVEDGIENAMLRYGKELGKCGHCGRTLTDEDSRARGIGPVCANVVQF